MSLPRLAVPSAHPVLFFARWALFAVARCQCRLGPGRRGGGTLMNRSSSSWSSARVDLRAALVGGVGGDGRLCVLFRSIVHERAIPPGFVDEFTDTVNKRKFKEAFDMARNEPSFLGQVLTAGMSRLQYGLEDAREAAMNTLEAIKSDKEQKNNYNAVIATLGPMFGLVGTVYGMIKSFSVLATATQVNPSKLADGISHALVVTLFGVGISVPAIFFNAFFKNRITRVCMDVGHIADDLLTQMYHNSAARDDADARRRRNDRAAARAPVPPQAGGSRSEVSEVRSQF